MKNKIIDRSVVTAARHIFVWPGEWANPEEPFDSG
jgi:hypothetical protein